MSRPFDTDSPLCPILLMIGVPIRVMDAALQAQSRSHVILVEPDPDLAAQIKTRQAGQPGVRVLAAAVTAAQDAGPIALVQYNQPGLRSAQAPTGHLKRLFPGLKPRVTQDVPSIALAQVLADAGLDQPKQAPPEGKAELWLDTGGREAEILQAMIAQDGLAHVARIVLRCGVEPLFGGALGAADLTSLLRRQGFGLVGPVGDDPDWPELHFERDVVLTELCQALAHQHRAQDQARAQYGALETKFQMAQTNYAEHVTALETQVSSLRENLAQTTAALEAKGGTVSAIEERLAQARRKIDQHTKELSDQAAQTQAAVDKAGAQATDRAQKARGSAEKDAAAARADLALALRMQTLAQSDLRDLQTRYDRSERTCQSQATLLQKLTPRLQQAAAQLQALTLAEGPYHEADDPSVGSLPPLEAAPAKDPAKDNAAPTAPTPKAKPAPKARRARAPKPAPAKPKPTKSGTPSTPKSESPR